jgi:NTP pyrophosphatase (non-canonical NTP hydrolase)
MTLDDDGKLFIDGPQTISIQYIREERRRQDEKWGVQNHDNLYWLGILVEEVGELSKAIIEGKMTHRELTQVAAVALAWMECHERHPRT